MPLFSLLAPTVTASQDVFAWVSCLDHDLRVYVVG